MSLVHVPWLSFTVALLVLAALAIIAALVRGRVAVDFPYLKRSGLFSAAERAFLGVLDQAVGGEYRVFGKVRVLDVADIRGGLSRNARQIAKNRIQAKHFDFVVCKASDLSVVCAVELDDKSHSTRDAQGRDAIKTGVCETIGLPLLRIASRRTYGAAELRERFLHALHPSAPSSEDGPLSNRLKP